MSIEINRDHLNRLLSIHRSNLQAGTETVESAKGVEFVPTFTIHQIINAQKNIADLSTQLGQPSEASDLQLDKLKPYMPTRPEKEQRTDLDPENLVHLKKLEAIHEINLAHLTRQKLAFERRDGKVPEFVESSITKVEAELRGVQEKLYA